MGTPLNQYKAFTNSLYVFLAVKTTYQTDFLLHTSSNDVKKFSGNS